MHENFLHHLIIIIITCVIGEEQYIGSIRLKENKLVYIVLYDRYLITSTWIVAGMQNDVEHIQFILLVLFNVCLLNSAKRATQAQQHNRKVPKLLRIDHPSDPIAIGMPTTIIIINAAATNLVIHNMISSVHPTNATSDPFNEHAQRFRYLVPTLWTNCIRYFH